MRKSSSLLSRLLLAALAAGLALLLCHDPQAFMAVAPPTATAANVHAQQKLDFPELSRVETLIGSSCAGREDREALGCLRGLDQLLSFHLQSALACGLDEWNCVVLGFLDRLCAGIRGPEGVSLLDRVSHSAHALRRKFPSWNAAFFYADWEHRGHLTVDNFVALMHSMGAGLTDEEARTVFAAADANGDGVLSVEEFSRFWAAMAFAHKHLKPGTPPEGPSDMEGIPSWSATGTLGSWAGLRNVVRGR